MSTAPPKVKDAKLPAKADIGAACAWLERPENRSRWGTPARMNAWYSADTIERAWFIVLWGEPNTIVYGPDIGAVCYAAARELGYR